MAAGDGLDGYGEEGPGMVFHYKQGSFREREDQKTRDLATGASLPKRGLFRALVGTRGNRTMFVVLVMAVAVTLIVSLLSRGPEEDTVDGVRFELAAFSFNGEVYASLAFTDGTPSRRASGVPHGQRLLAVVFEAVNTDGAVADRTETEVLFDFDAADADGTVYARAVFADYDIVRIRCEVSGGDGRSAAVSAAVRQH